MLKRAVTVKQLDDLGFIYKDLGKHWYLVRFYACREKLLYHLIFPLRLKDEA